MFSEGLLDKALRTIKSFIPKPLFDLGAKIYHPLLAYTGAARYGFPSLKLTVIGVTGTKGKSTTVYLISELLERTGHPTAAIGSLGYKIKEKTWPNLLKMTMPGRWKMQKFLHEAVRAGCEYMVIECPSEGLAQGRHLGVKIDCAVFLNIHPEHLEAHGGWDNYRAAKQILFHACHGTHILNADDPNVAYFSRFSARKHITYGIASGDVHATDVHADAHRASFTVGRTTIHLRLAGLFNVYNALAALAVADVYGIPASEAKDALESIASPVGRMEWVQTEPFGVVVDYAHTPDSLRAVYRTLKPQSGRLICVLGSAGGGRDKWKRPEFGNIAQQYCDVIYLTDEDPFEENPEAIVADIQKGMSSEGVVKTTVVMDRRQAISEAIAQGRAGDIVVITGKGSETSMALAGGKKIPWSDVGVVQEVLRGVGL